MRRILTLGLVLLAGSALVAAAQEAPQAPRVTDDRLSDAESEIRALWRSYFAVVKDGLPNTKGSVPCGSGHYEEIKATNSYLVFFAACERIERHQNGYRAAILIGNPHAFTFTKVNGTLSYGENVAAALVREKQRVPFATATELKSGAWLQIDVPIALAGEKDVSTIIVELQVSGAMGPSADPPIRPTYGPQNGAHDAREHGAAPAAPRTGPDSLRQ